MPEGCCVRILLMAVILLIAHIYTLYIIAQTAIPCNNKISLALFTHFMYNTYNYGNWLRLSWVDTCVDTRVEPSQ